MYYTYWTYWIGTNGNAFTALLGKMGDAPFIGTARDVVTLAYAGSSLLGTSENAGTPILGTHSYA
jgi:hypothetical protein